MAVNIDDVYQQVLAIANKEQRGYITPQEFNLIARRAQLQIFEEYFLDIKKAHLRLGNSSEASDELEMLNERVSVFREESPIGYQADGVYDIGLPYKLLNVHYGGSEIEEVNNRRSLVINSHPLSSPTENHRIYTRVGGGEIKIMPNIPDTGSFYVHKVRKPSDPYWGYVVVNEKALYNPNTSTNFELHESEEQNLVSRILELAGIVMKKQDLTSIAGGLIQRDKIEENN